ncbi:unnamed protein product [Caenorhabditis angaria]|uniref:Uncharacterized protein n=1 Tax=Caenorhabditis angaria TaxID=860376 RepID=A0A9P1ISS6_9PELO|nr:unnamed protein product [Caenorhabditis angaria]
MCESEATSNLRFMTIINTSVVAEKNLTEIFHWALKIEIGVLFFSWIEFLYLFYLFLFIRAMHFNLNFLFMVYGGQYFCSMVARIFILYYQLGYENLKDWLILSNYVRTIALVIAFNVLPIFMFERCVATFLVKNYEKSIKFHVPVIILLIFFPFCGISGFAYIQCWIPLTLLIAGFFVINITGYLGINSIRDFNVKRHRKFNTVTRKSSPYVLSERFQLAENIKMLDILKKVQISILFFNVASTSILLMDYFRIDPIILYTSYMIYNYFLALYAITVPIILHASLPEWKKETKRLILKIRGKNAVGVCPRNTFGKQMIYTNPKEEADIYFTQFDSVLNKV